MAGSNLIQIQLKMEALFLFWIPDISPIEASNLGVRRSLVWWCHNS